MMGEAHASWDIKTRWKCSFCNFVVIGENSPDLCPMCRHKGGFSLFRDFSDFSQQCYD